MYTYMHLPESSKVMICFASWMSHLTALFDFFWQIFTIPTIDLSIPIPKYILAIFGFSNAVFTRTGLGIANISPNALKSASEDGKTQIINEIESMPQPCWLIRKQSNPWFPESEKTQFAHYWVDLCTFCWPPEKNQFPTCQVRVVRFYQSCCCPPPPPPPPVSPRPCLPPLPRPLLPCQLLAKLFANFGAQCALLDLNLGPSQLSAHRWTSTWDLAGPQPHGTFPAQCAPLDLNLGPSELSAHRWTSTAR